MMEYLRDESDHSWPSLTGGGWHHMEFAPVCTMILKKVVDPNCWVHSMENLFCLGDSCFTTGSAINPTLTIVALSLRLSDHVKELLDNKGRNSLWFSTFPGKQTERDRQSRSFTFL
ncbi:MAG: GMC family oxidoreductase [Sphingobacterium sp.]|nr:GMC family oxidoreductase [Sphingobacterium sp.]